MSNFNALGFHSELKTAPRFAGPSYPPLYAKPIMPPTRAAPRSRVPRSGQELRKEPRQDLGQEPRQDLGQEPRQEQRPTAERMVAGRVDYLEAQEKRQAAALAQCGADVDSLSERLQQAHAAAQLVYARATTELRGTDEVDGDEEAGAPVAVEGAVVVLAFPQERVRDGDDAERVRMRCKSVDPTTGQLSFAWVTVYARHGRRHVRCVGDFSLVPP